MDPASSLISLYALHLTGRSFFAGEVVNLVSAYSSATVLHLRGPSLFAGVTAALIIVLPGELWLWNRTLLDITYAASHQRFSVSGNLIS